MDNMNIARISINSIKITEESEILWKELIIIAGLIFIQLLGSKISELTYVCLAIWSISSPKHAIQALSLSWLLTFLNPGIFIGTEGGTTLRWFVIFCAFSNVIISYIIYKKFLVSRTIICLFLFLLITSLLSILKSYEPVVSLLKLTSFTLGVVTILLAFELSLDQKNYWKAWFTTLCFFIIISSLPLYFFEFGYFRNERGFQGILNHPQAYGVFLAPIVSWFMGRLLFEGNRSIFVIIMTVLGAFSLSASLSRTGMLAIFSSFCLTIIVGVFQKAEWRNTLSKTVGSYIGVMILCLIISIILINFLTIKEYVTEYMRKGSQASNFVEIYERSRGSLIEASMDNFYDNPWTGIGFGIASNPFSFNINTNQLGIPIGASVEKGFLPSAILEEIGIFGAIPFIIFIIVLMQPILYRGSLCSLWLFFSCIMVNMGEMIFFSVGGMGLYIWLLIGFSRIIK
ncbi:putative O-antigen ligase family protein [Candidatus Magnetomoraceae bacterium gMMP-15]